MIDSIEIKNIQSHKNTKIEFCSGVNAIVGSSNNGKTAILRSLYWARYNRPLGIDTLCSHWTLDDKGNQKEEMSVKIIKNGKELSRIKTKNENKYIVDGKELSAVKTDVPVEVEEFFSLSETNIQNQQDSPFLISSSSGDVGKYFNKIVHLDVIDKVLANAESTKRKVKQEKQVADDLVKKYSEQLKEYDWLDKVEKLITKYKNISDKIDGLFDKIFDLNSDIESHDEFILEIKKYEDICSNKKFVDKMFNLISKFDLKINEIEKLENLFSSHSNYVSKINELNECVGFKKQMSDYEKYRDEFEKINNKIESLNSDLSYVDNCIDFDFTKEKKLIEQLEKTDCEKIENEIIQFKNSIKNYEELISEIESNEKIISENKKQLPKVCPLCGHSMEE